MKATLKHFTPLSVVVEAVRTCWDSMDKSDSFFHDLAPYPYFRLGPKDKKLILAVIKKNHQSVLEHCSYNFYLEGVPRFVLQEHARHRISSFSVQSTRYTLSELKGHEPFIHGVGRNTKIHPDCSKYIYLSDNQDLNLKSICDLEYVRRCVDDGIPNDEIKQILPESYLCKMMWTVNIRSFRNYLQLRTDSSAHKVIQELARIMYEQLPESHKFLFEDCVK